MDGEEEYYPEEISKLKKDVEKEGLGLIVFGEWYNVDTMIKMKFFDDNTRSWWTPVTGKHAPCTLWLIKLMVTDSVLNRPYPQGWVPSQLNQMPYYRMS